MSGLLHVTSAGSELGGGVKQAWDYIIMAEQTNQVLLPVLLKQSVQGSSAGW